MLLLSEESAVPKPPYYYCPECGWWSYELPMFVTMDTSISLCPIDKQLITIRIK
jgi:hypothetical protein